MSDRILYDSVNKITGKMLAQFVDSAKDTLALGRRIKGVLDAAQFGAPADWAAVASELGLPSTQAGADAAQAAATIVANAMSQIDSAQINELARLDQG